MSGCLYFLTENPLRKQRWTFASLKHSVGSLCCYRASLSFQSSSISHPWADVTSPLSRDETCWHWLRDTRITFAFCSLPSSYSTQRSDTEGANSQLIFLQKPISGVLASPWMLFPAHADLTLRQWGLQERAWNAWFPAGPPGMPPAMEPDSLELEIPLPLCSGAQLNGKIFAPALCHLLSCPEVT